jgi:F0F1-type ATP synthase assembly protein I
MPEEPKNKSSLKDILSKPLVKSDSSILQYSGIGVQLAAVIIVFLFLGIWLDGLLETKFIFTLIFTLIGFAGGFYSFFLSVQKLSKKPGKDIKKP